MEPRWSRCGPLCLPRHCLLLLLLCGSGFFQSHAVDVEVKDSSNATCIYAKWMMSFFIKYETNSSEYRNATLHVSPNVTHDGSTCGNETFAPLLAIQFGAGHFWSINFTKTSGTYRGSIITFTYNTNDTAVFQDAKKRGPVTIVVNDTMHPVQLNRVYKCHHNESIEAENVTQSFWDVTLQAFVQNGTVSKNESICDADAPTSVPPVGNLTTASTTSSPAPTTTPKPVEKPVPGNYSLKNGNQTCFLATMGLQLNASQEKPSVININPKTTHVTGSCGNTSATLKLNDSNSRFIDFVFLVKNTSANTQRFYLKEVNVTLHVSTNGSEILHAENHNLSKWDTSLGSSYMCQKEQTVEVNEDFQIHTFDLRVQPFLVKENKYSTAEECFADSDLNFLIPIAVGVALGFLIILVFISYIVGRRKSRTGYQSV